jgi:hypothetical protein
MAEAYYGVPEDLKQECLRRIPQDIKAVLLRFDRCRIPRKEREA